IIGANFGPFKSVQHLELYRKWFNEIDSISFRDFKSYQLFKDQKNVRWYPDLLFSYNLPEFIKSQNTITIVPIYNNHRIGLPEYSNEDYFSFIANVSVEYIEKGFDITLASFCIHQQDSLATNKIYSTIPKKYRNRVSVIEYVNDIDYFLKKFLSSKFI